MPYFCSNCGTDKRLKLENQKFFYQTAFGWLGLMVGVTYEFVWDVKMYFCRDCHAKRQRNVTISYYSLLVGILLTIGFFVLSINAFPNFKKCLFYSLLSLLTLVFAFITKAAFQSLDKPKVVEINRQRLVVSIPRHGDFVFADGGRLKH